MFDRGRLFGLGRSREVNRSSYEEPRCDGAIAEYCPFCSKRELRRYNKKGIFFCWSCKRFGLLVTLDLPSRPDAYFGLTHQERASSHGLRDAIGSKIDRPGA